MSRRRKSTDTTPFDTLRLEGSLFVPELLERSSPRRCRIQFTNRRRDLTSTLIAEDCVTLAFAGHANPQRLTNADPAQLLAAEPASHSKEAAPTDHIQTTLNFFQSQTPCLDNIASECVCALLAGNRRVREAARDVGSYEVTSCLPVDVLGVYVLLPATI